jgi:hypothetical protein
MMKRNHADIRGRKGLFFLILFFVSCFLFAQETEEILSGEAAVQEAEVLYEAHGAEADAETEIEAKGRIRDPKSFKAFMTIFVIVCAVLVIWLFKDKPRKEYGEK